MCHPGRVDDATWAALALTLTALGGVATWLAFRRRGTLSGLRMLALTLLVPAAYLTQTLRMLTRIVDAVGDWATSLVFNPTVWLGIVLAGISGVLFVVTGMMRDRQLNRSRGGEAASAPPGEVRGRSSTKKKLPPAASTRGEPAIDDDMADIEAILKRRGIS